MNRESAQLALAGAMIGVLALSATVFAQLHPPELEETTAVLAAVLETAARNPEEENWSNREAVAVMAELEAPKDASTAGPFSVALRVPDPIPGEKLFVCDGLGCPLDGIEPDWDGDAVLGPFAPGCYSVQRGQTEVGSFCLQSNASISETSGRLWTDGELLYLERYSPGTVRLIITLVKPGYYAVGLCDRDGRTWRGDLYVAEGTEPDADGIWVQTLELQGLPPGRYTAIRQNQPLGQVEVQSGETAELEIKIDNLKAGNTSDN